MSIFALFIEILVIITEKIIKKNSETIIYEYDGVS